MPLLQYKSTHFAKVLPIDSDEVPEYVEYGRKKIAYLVSDNFTDTSSLRPWESRGRHQLRYGGNKFILLELERHTVSHFHRVHRSTEYIKVQTQDPFEENTDMLRPFSVWVEAAWVEPLTRVKSYEDEAKIELLASLKKKWDAKKK